MESAVLFPAELNRMIRWINRRIEKMPLRGTIKPKRRIVVSSSLSRPPPNFPDWAVRENCSLHLPLLHVTLVDN